MTWEAYLRKQRKLKLEQIDAMTTSNLEVRIVRNGETRDITHESLEREKQDVAEIEEILASEGVQFD
ncbi:hypothetical protein V5F89_12355 [Pelagerythrobacter marensis]|uniref:Uncharacterized protein n=1 Tax=Pelagerythrobacter marensis TaxID=543877 RepID=A0ABZ2D738_9SPHN